MTPKQIPFPRAIKTLTDNVELMKILNRIGHSCSNSRLEEIGTVLCIHKLNSVDSAQVPLPVNIHPSVPIVLAFDDIDRQEEVLSGAGT